MTIPTREEALKALATLNTMADGYIALKPLGSMNERGMWNNREAACARLRSYIESHAGEPVTYGVFDRTGKLRFVAPNEHDAHMALILSSRDPDEFDVETMVKPLYASPVQPDPTCAKNAQVQTVQPVLEWRGDHLEFNGVKIGNLIKAGGGGQDYFHSFTVYDCPTKAMKRSDKIAEMEQRARQWLSGGGK